MEEWGVICPRRRARERLAPAAATATLTATLVASFIARLRSRAALLHLPRSREIPLLHWRPSGEILLLHRATEAAGLRRRKAALLRLLLRRRKVTRVILMAKLASRLLRSETALCGRLHCRSRVVPVPCAIAAREVRPVVL